MKRLGLLMVGLLISSCALLWGSPLTAQRIAPDQVRISATVGPTLVIASSRSIQSWQPTAACERRSVASDPTRGLSCPVSSSGLLVTVQTVGAVSAQLINGITPVTAPVVVP